MLLTVFYIAATWLQSYRLSSIKRKLKLLTETSSFVLYPISKCDDESDGVKPAMSSTFSKNFDQAHVYDFLWDNGNFRACTLMPKVVDLSKWISITEDVTFPLVLDKSVLYLKEPRLFILLEALSIELNQRTDTSRFNINRLGVLIAWKMKEAFGLVLESDIDHLAELSSNFMSSPIFIDEGLQVSRIQTVDVQGQPCMVINSSRIPVYQKPTRSFSIESPDEQVDEWPSRPSLWMSPSQWLLHTQLLRSFSVCAEEASEINPVMVPEYRTACVTRGSRGASVASPISIDIPENVDAALETMSKRFNPDSNSVTPEINEILGGSIYPLNCDKRDSELELSIPSEKISKARDNFTLKNEFSVVGTPSTRSETSSCASTPARILPHNKRNLFASISSLGSTTASSMSFRSCNSVKMKPPNILVYSESNLTSENIKAVLSETLHRHKYTIYNVTKEELSSGTWAVNCSLLVVCGNLPENLEPILINYLLLGGRLFCLCSAFLHSLLPTFRTAEVRERELVRFTYAKWNRVRLMHHVFCYQNSPARTKFSREADEPPNEKDRVSPVPMTPATVQVMDCEGGTHTLHVQVLGKEETWQTPSLLLAYFPSPAGRVVFSQVHLELDPSEILEEREGEALRSSDAARREIIRDILSTHLGLDCASLGKSDVNQHTVAYFLGRHELKLAFLEKIRGCDRLGTLPVKFCGKGETPPPASVNLLPILIHSCPMDFSTLEYFETLLTESLGRLLIYCEVLGSSMDLITEEVAHGLTIVPSHQTSGKGRSKNQWLSPPGCVMFSQQLHFPVDSYVGRHPSILQHAVGVAVVSSLSEISVQHSQALDLHLKWPNDIYTGDMIKIGGVLANCSVNGSTVVCNIGCGVNLDNDSPTTCLNSQIKTHNKELNQKIPKLTRERVLALIFNKLETIFDRMQEGDVSYLHELYYTYWLHGGSQVNVAGPSGDLQPVVVCGIDEFGYLRVREQTGYEFSVQPDGNSFDMMEGLIMPKTR